MSVKLDEIRALVAVTRLEPDDGKTEGALRLREGLIGQEQTSPHKAL
jgi:hypothetical protein